MTVHTFVVETDLQTAYGITYGDYPPKMDVSDVEALFDISEKGAVGERGTVITKHSLMLQNCPAREFEFKAGGKANYSGRIRLILVGRRIYSVMTIFLTANPHSEDRLKFFNSFSVHDEQQALPPQPDISHDLNNQA